MSAMNEAIKIPELQKNLLELGREMERAGWALGSTIKRGRGIRVWLRIAYIVRYVLSNDWWLLFCFVCFQKSRLVEEIVADGLDAMEVCSSLFFYL